MKTTALFLVLGFVLSAQAEQIPYQDDRFNCLSQAQAQRYISDFGIDTRSFGGLELCNSRVDTKKLFNDLEIIEKGEFDTTSSGNPFIGGFVPAHDYYNWMKRETRGVKRGQDVPYATAYNSGGYFTMQDGWAKLSTLGRVGTVIHEARHTAGYRHIRCTQGTYQGTSVAGCDSTYNYGGSHAVEMEYYARVSVQGKNFHPVYQKMARLMAIARSNIFFNAPVIRAREAVLGLSADRAHAQLFDREEWYTREAPQVNGRLKRTSFGAVLFDGMQAMAIELYQNSGFADLIPDTYSYFKVLGEGAATLKDFEEFDEGTKRYVVKVSKDNKLAMYDFPNGAWGRDQALPFEVAMLSTAALGNTQSGLYLVSTAGEIYNFQPSTKRIVKTNLTWNPEHQEVIVYKGQNLVLLKSGQVLVQDGQDLKPWSATNELLGGLVNVPVYDGFEVVRQ